MFGSVVNRLGASVRRALSQYAVGANEPELALNFIDNEYITNNSTSTFASAVTHSMSSNSTMVDSDGYIKWAPHNLLTYSEDFSNSGWLVFGASKASTTETDPAGGSTALRLTNLQGAADNRLYQIFTEDARTFGVFLKGTAGETVTIEIDTQKQNVTLTSDWALYTVTMPSTPSTKIVRIINRAVNSNTADEVYVAFAHAYRSDLGGMVDNPDRGDSYVPTTSSEKYLPRIGHYVFNGSAWANEGLLAESEARTNLYDNNDSMHTNGGQNSTLSADGGTAPDGTDDAVKLLETTATGEHTVFMAQSVITTGKTYTCSVFVKSVGGRNVKFGFSSINFPSATRLTFDLDNLTVSTPDQGTIQEVGNGWYRLSVTSTSDSTGTRGDNNAVLQPLDGTTSSYAGDTAKGILFYGMQIEEGATPSSYIPTFSTTTATRAAETFTIPSANLPWNDNNVSIAMDGRMTFSDNDDVNEVLQYRWFDTITDRIQAYVTTGGTNTGKQVFYQEASDVVNFKATAADHYEIGVLTPFDIASRHGSTFINAATEGVALTVDSTPTELPDLSATDMQIAYIFMGTIGTFRVWDRDITDDGLIEATNPSLEPSLSLTFEGTGTNSFVVNDWSE